MHKHLQATRPLLSHFQYVTKEKDIKLKGTNEGNHDEAA